MAALALWQRLLADGPKTWAEIVTAGKVEGMPEEQLRQARRDLGLVRTGMGPGTHWGLPGQAAQES
jgi:hypothetical protein